MRSREHKRGKEGAVGAQGHPGGDSKETVNHLSRKLGLVEQATETEQGVICPLLKSGPMSLQWSPGERVHHEKKKAKAELRWHQGKGGWQGREATGTQRNVVREAGEEPGQPGVMGSKGRCFRREHSAGTNNVGSGDSPGSPAVKTLHLLYRACAGGETKILHTAWPGRGV